MDLQVRPSGLVVPPNVTDARDQYLTAKECAKHTAAAMPFHRLLQQVDSRLSLLFAKPGAAAFPRSPRFYIVRMNEAAPDAFWVIEDEKGEYCEPEAAHLNRFRQGDAAANPDLWRKYRRSWERYVADAEAKKRAIMGEFHDKLLDRVNHELDRRIVVPEWVGNA